MFLRCFGIGQSARKHQRDVETSASKHGVCSSEADVVPAPTPRVEPAPVVEPQLSISSRRPAAASQTFRSSSKHSINAAPLIAMDAANVEECDPRKILDGLRISQKVLGRGSYGVVVEGTYHGVAVAVKIMVSQGLDRAALRELLLAPNLVHPNVVSSYTTRCASITQAFLNEMKGANSNFKEPSPTDSRQLSTQLRVARSDDGFGDPTGLLGSGSDSLRVLYPHMCELKAVPGQMLVVAVQELCRMGNLGQAVRNGVFSRSDAWSARVAHRALLRTVSEMARGLLHLHGAGVVHGDVKPANMLLQSAELDRRGFTLKVADFGVAHVLPQAATSVVTETWGSVAYMAPEGFTGKASRATDVWAFGVVLWQMVTGGQPYDGVPQTQVMFGVNQGLLKLEWPTAVYGAPVQLGARVVLLGQRCTSFTPAERPDLEEVLKELISIETEMRTTAASKPPEVAATANAAAGVATN